MTLELTAEEFNTLHEVLENDIEMLKSEVLHTDAREYKILLRHKEMILEKILEHAESGESRLVENQVLGR